MDTLLIVEDEPVLRASMVRGLAKLPGVEIVNAGTTADAKVLISAIPPTMLISDLDLPDGSGLDLLAELDRRDLRIPVLFVSAYLRRFKVPQRSGIELLEKPVPLSRLRDAVTKNLGGHHNQSAFGLADYVQLAGMGRRSVKLNVLRDGTRVGEVVIKDGDAWHAEDLRGEGPEAFVRLMTDHDLLVEPESSGRIEAVPRTLEGSAEHVLLESARRIDESSRDLKPVTAAGDGDLETGWDDLDEPAPTAVPHPPLAAAPQPPVLGGALRTAPARPEGPPIPREEPTPTPAPTRKADWVPSKTDRDERSSTFGPTGRLSKLSFDELYERGVEALLDKRYADAYAAFCEAHEQRTTPSLEANLNRLKALGYGR